MAGVVSADETCPVAVEKERLYLKLRAFPIRAVKQKKTEAAEVLRRNIRFIILRIMRYGPDFFFLSADFRPMRLDMMSKPGKEIRWMMWNGIK